MEKYLELLINKLDPSSIILVATLYGVYVIAKSAMAKFSEHGVKVTNSLESIAKDCTALRVDLAIIAARVDLHEGRIDRLESK